MRNSPLVFDVMRTRRLKLSGVVATYHCMTRTVNGERLFGDREKEVLRKMIWQVADFCGVEILTYCIMENHFHVLVSVPDGQSLSDEELMRRYRVLYPKPTKYQTASAQVMENTLAAGGEEADGLRRRLLARMGNVSEFMKAVKQRFSVWYNRSHERYGTLWAERFKSVLVEGSGNPLQTMATYIDLNPVRAGLVEDPKDYRFCGYAEAVAGKARSREGLRKVWSDRKCDLSEALASHRLLMFGRAAADGRENRPKLSGEDAAAVLEEGTGELSRSVMLRCRVRYFTDGAILGSAEFVRGFADLWQYERRRRYPPQVNPVPGADWGDLATIKGLRKKIFS